MMLVWGLASGLSAALVLTRLLAHLLYRVRPTDISATTLAALVLVAVALAAGYVPCRRAASVDPLLAEVRDSEADKHALIFSFRPNLSYVRPPWRSHSASSRSGGPSSAKKRLRPSYSLCRMSRACR